MIVSDIVSRSLDGEEPTAEEVAALFRMAPLGRESALVMAASREKSARASGGRAEVHGQVGVNVGPCQKNCRFCAFAAVNGVFRENVELPVEDVVTRSIAFERDGANAVLLMSTAQYSFGNFVEIAAEVRGHLRPQTRLVANIGDMNVGDARRLAAAGVCGIYHAVRLGEGRDTSISPETRLQTMRNAKEAGLLVGTCLEPVGNEHSVGELVEKTLITQDVGPVYSGSARRIPIPGTEMAESDIVSEARMAHILAVVRLALGYDTKGNCTHEPNVIGAAAGANLLWAEAGANPRDTEKDTERNRGMTVADCREVYAEADLDVLDGPSVFYSA